MIIWHRDSWPNGEYCRMSRVMKDAVLPLWQSSDDEPADSVDNGKTHLGLVLTVQ